MAMMTKSGNIYIPEKQNDGASCFINVPLCRQETVYTCGVACLQSLLKCYGFDYRQDELAQKLQSRPVKGTDFRNIIMFVRTLGFDADFLKNMSIDTLKSLIDHSIPPLLLIQAWKDEGVDYASDWKDGHYVVACGYANNRIFFMDPWTHGNYTYITISELLARWHCGDKFGHRYYNSGLIIINENCPFKYDPYDVKYLG